MDTTNNVFPIDMSGISPMQTETNGLATMDQTLGQQQQQAPAPSSGFAQNDFINVSFLELGVLR